MRYRIIFARNRSVARSSRRDYIHVNGNLLGGLHADVLNLSVLQDGVATFIKRKARGNFVPMFFYGEFHSEFSAGLFVTFGEKNHVAVQSRLRALQCNKDCKIRGQHSFVVNRAPSVKVAVFYYGGERVHGPFGFIDADHIQMSHQEQRTRRVGHGAGGKACDQESAARGALEDFRWNSFAFQDIGNVFGGYDLVTRRIGGIDANQVLEPNERFALKFYDVRARSSGWLRQLRCRALPRAICGPTKHAAECQDKNSDVRTRHSSVLLLECELQR